MFRFIKSNRAAAAPGWVALCALGLFAAGARGQETKPASTEHLDALGKSILEAKVPPDADKEATPRPPSLPVDSVKWISNGTESRAIHLTVYSAALRQQYGDTKAAEGRGMLV